jgi:type II secretory pathway component PulF
VKLVYEAWDKSGRRVDDSVEAPDVAQATERLRRQGLYVTKIGEPRSATAAGGAAGAVLKHTRGGRGKRLNQLVTFSRQLHVLVSTGTPLVQALMALERQVRDVKWKEIVADVRKRVEEGASLSDAMSHHPDHFDSVARSLIAAGESSGNFDAMLDRLALLARKQLYVRRLIIGAMVYPSLLLVVSMGVLVVMLTFVLPRFVELFDSLDMPLPPSTKFLMGVSTVLTGYWWAVLGASVALVVGLRFWLLTPVGRRAWDGFVLALPQIGRMARSFATARVTRLLGVLIQGKVPLLDALHLTRDATRNAFYVELIVKAEEAVTKGEPVSAAFADERLISPAVYEAMRNGEKSGQIGQLLLHVSDFLDEENEIIVKSLTSILEPVIMIVLGALVGFVAVSMFTPLFDLTSMAQGGG